MTSPSPPRYWLARDEFDAVGVIKFETREQLERFGYDPLELEQQ